MPNVLRVFTGVVMIQAGLAYQEAMNARPVDALAELLLSWSPVLRPARASFANTHRSSELMPKMQDGRIRGTVKYFDTGKGFGYIQRDDGEEDVIVYAINIKGDFDSLVADESVEFGIEVGVDTGKAQAIDVTLVHLDDEDNPEGDELKHAGFEDHFDDNLRDNFVY
eukprot:CAMPEP_0169128710 /NCGR_PEP_ID=MMETSP1015-20121227/36720_1 /TAXON_ID=342587 /ORGANISM="Karlodinium micrum, Strain CCMP2283" /LENGTH=166 /DNA_ID=CAMNT_0009192645 /DNA_START=51 /DNA_END=551 /DNA_ORIENTATION=+